jgi:hypothetical protein
MTCQRIAGSPASSQVATGSDPGAPGTTRDRVFITTAAYTQPAAKSRPVRGGSPVGLSPEEADESVTHGGIGGYRYLGAEQLRCSGRLVDPHLGAGQLSVDEIVVEGR